MTTKAPEKKTGEMIADRIDIIDVDCHIQEPVDIWTSRVSKKWGKRVPHVRAHPETGKPVWFINEEPSIPVAGLSMAGWKEWPPSHPPTLEEADHAAWDSTVRLERMDGYGIHTEILYPNVGGFGNQNFMKLEDPKLFDKILVEARIKHTTIGESVVFVAKRDALNNGDAAVMIVFEAKLKKKRRQVHAAVPLKFMIELGRECEKLQAEIGA